MRRAGIVGLALASASAAIAAAVLILGRDAGSGNQVPPGDPAVFVKSVLASIVEDKYERAWKTLHPAHQQVALFREYAVCENRTQVGGKLRAADVVRVRDVLARMPGEPERVPATAVTLRIKIYQPALQSVDTFTQTFNAVASGSRWTWILTPAKYKSYSTDTC